MFNIASTNIKIIQYILHAVTNILIETLLSGLPESQQTCSSMQRQVMVWNNDDSRYFRAEFVGIL